MRAISGIMVYYCIVCKRKLWYFLHNINMESQNEDVSIGKYIDENTFKREEKQLNPTISYLHEPGLRRFSLCLDISEIFKPILADRLIFSMLNKNQISEKSFTNELNYLHITKETSQKICMELDKRLGTTISHKTLDKQVSYQYLIRLELYKLIKHLLGEQEYEGFQIWW